LTAVEVVVAIGHPPPSPMVDALCPEVVWMNPPIHWGSRPEDGMDLVNLERTVAALSRYDSRDETSNSRQKKEMIDRTERISSRIHRNKRNRMNA